MVMFKDSVCMLAEGIVRAVAVELMSTSVYEPVELPVTGATPRDQLPLVLSEVVAELAKVLMVPAIAGTESSRKAARGSRRAARLRRVVTAPDASGPESWNLMVFMDFVVLCFLIRRLENQKLAKCGLDGGF